VVQQVVERPRRADIGLSATAWQTVISQAEVA
jgi:hypothetical protein